MAYIKISGFKGKIYIPDENKDNKKHNCPDCYYCQVCSDDRCCLCLEIKAKKCNDVSLRRSTGALS